jgi:guanylate kinase
MQGIRPFPIVIAAPSGAGKTTLARSLVQRTGGLEFSISATTRPARPNEVDGRDYYFVDDAEFDRQIASGELLEWAVVHGRRYGTPRRSIEEPLRRGHTVVLDIDVEGAQQVRAAFPEAVLVFVLPPSVGELVRRLSGRGSESLEERRTRLGTAWRELGVARDFDYVVVNDHFEAALGALHAILTAEQHRVGRMRDFTGIIDRMREEMATHLKGSG